MVLKPHRGCFVADADPSTVTDPDVADTDGGGANDGLCDSPPSHGNPPSNGPGARGGHAIAYDAEGKAIGTGRLLPDGHIGRMAVLQAARGTGVGRNARSDRRDAIAASTASAPGYVPAITVTRWPQASQRATWLALCPDPNLMLGIADERFARLPATADLIGKFATEGRAADHHLDLLPRACYRDV